MQWRSYLENPSDFGSLLPQTNTPKGYHFLFQSAGLGLRNSGLMQLMGQFAPKHAKKLKGKSLFFSCVDFA
jgi:hypothetical protein